MTKHQKEVIAKALLLIEWRELMALKSLEGESFEPSQAYRESMQRLIRKETHWTRPFFRNNKRKALTALIAALLIFASLFSISAIREPIIQYVKTIYEKCTHFCFEEDSAQYETVIETEYKPTWIPKGYQLCIRKKETYEIRSEWKNDNDYIKFTQTPIGVDSLHLNTEAENYSRLERNGKTYYYNQTQNAYFFIWTIDNYAFNLTCENLEMDDILKILDSIQPISTP